MGCGCKNCSYTFGIAIGSIYTLASLIIFILSSVTYFTGTNAQEQPKIMVTALVVAVVSAVFIYAIVKKNHHLMLPWIMLSTIIFIGTSGFIFIGFFAISLFRGPHHEYLEHFIVGLCILVIELAIHLYSCWLYRDVRKNNTGRLSNAAVSYQSKDNSYAPISDKSLI